MRGTYFLYFLKIIQQIHSLKIHQLLGTLEGLLLSLYRPLRQE